MARQRTWRQLVLGLATLGVAAGAATWVLTFARIGKVKGETATLYMVTDAAAGVINGTAVWFNGQKIGTVKAIRFQPASADTLERVAIEMDVRTDALRDIRHNALVQLRPGNGLIGEPVVYITGGSTAYRGVRPGDTLHAYAQVIGLRPHAADFAALGDSVLAAGQGLQQASQQFRETGTEVDKIRRRSERQIAEVGRAIDQFSARAMGSHGTVSGFVHDDSLRSAVSRLRAQTDSIQQLFNSRAGALGRFRKDSSIFGAADRVRANMRELHDRLSAPLTAGRSNRALVDELARTQQQLDSLVANARRHPLRYLSL